jgi:hypothetical protein
MGTNRHGTEYRSLKMLLTREALRFLIAGAANNITTLLLY